MANESGCDPLRTLIGCELPDVNDMEGPASDYTAPGFEVPAKMIGEYQNASHNPNKGVISITEQEINIVTELYSVTLPVSNEMYYNNCYIKITFPDGSILQIWEYDGYDFIFIRLYQDGSWQEYGRYEPIEEVVLN